MRIEYDIIALAFFYFILLIESTNTKYEPTIFEFKDVQLWKGMLHLNLLHVTEDELLDASFSALNVDRQKNATQGNTIGHS